MRTFHIEFDSRVVSTQRLGTKVHSLYFTPDIIKYRRTLIEVFQKSTLLWADVHLSGTSKILPKLRTRVQPRQDRGGGKVPCKPLQTSVKTNDLEPPPPCGTPSSSPYDGLWDTGCPVGRCCLLLNWVLHSSRLQLFGTLNLFFEQTWNQASDLLIRSGEMPEITSTSSYWVSRYKHLDKHYIIHLFSLRGHYYYYYYLFIINIGWK